jgi:hypothetical protein
MDMVMKQTRSRVQVKEEPIWNQAGSPTVEPAYTWAYDQVQVQPNSS